MNAMLKRILTSLGYAITITVPTVWANGMPDTPDKVGAAVGVFAAAFWAKFSSNQTLIAPNRPAWTDEQRKQEALDQLNKGL